MKRSLFQQKDASIWIEIDVYQSEEGQIIVHGQDSGKVVQELKRRYDYEYFVVIKKEAVQDLMDKLAVKDVEALLDWFATHYSHHRAVSQIKKRLEELEVPYEFSTW